MKRKSLTLFLIALLFLNISYPVLSEETASAENTKKTTLERLDDYNERLKKIEVKSASTKPTYEFSAENDSKILLMTYKNINFLSYKLVSIISPKNNDDTVKNNGNTNILTNDTFILLTEKASITDVYLYDRSIDFLKSSIKEMKNLNEKLGKLINPSNQDVNKEDKSGIGTAIAGVTTAVTLLNLANEVASSFKPDIKSVNTNIKLDNKVINNLICQNFKKNKIKLKQIDDDLSISKNTDIYKKLIEIASLTDNLEFKIAKINSLIEEEKPKLKIKKEEAVKAVKEARAIMELLKDPISKVTNNIGKLVSYELAETLEIPVVYIDFVHNLGNLRTKQYNGLASIIKRDKIARNILIGMNYEIKTSDYTKKDIIWAVESNKNSIKNDDKINPNDKNKSYIFNNKPLERLPKNCIDLIDKDKI